ncbi:MAG: aldehyde ferredoxin oxidoreductase family protein [Desulfobacterales bacterium]|jgi:aldehyde:ferredoxin oxidoreductase
MFTGKLAKIDLDEARVEIEPISRITLRDYLGGRGLNMRLLFPSLSRPGDPFDPRSPIVFSPGLMCGIPSLGSRMSISARSPETGFLGDANMGGELGAALKASGISSLFITGRSSRPVYLWVQNQTVEIRDARKLWGSDPIQTQKGIRKELADNDIKVGCIGLAGENRVRFAGVRTGLKNMAGRTGMGAVMGSKNLKAIAVRGNLDIELKSPDGYLAAYQKIFTQLLGGKWVRALGRWGTPLLMQKSNTQGFLAVRNNQLTTLGDKGMQLGAESLDKYSTGMVSCTSCPAHCRHRYQILDGPYAGTFGEGPEYASIGSMGSKLGSADLERAIYASELCNRYGLDTISTGSYISWAMELYQRGIIGEDDIGYPLRWGDQEAIIKLIGQIAGRQGFGEILAEGSFACKDLGNGAGEFLLNIKNLPIEMTDERPTKAFALGMATASRGACHMRSRASLDVIGLPEDLLTKIFQGNVSRSYLDYRGKGRMVWWQERLNALCDSLGVCRFLSVFSSPHAPQAIQFCELLDLAFGEHFSEAELLDVGERISTLERMVLIGNGLSKADDTLPARYFNEPIPAGPAAGEVIDRLKFDEILTEYYSLHGWDSDGMPTEAALKKLGLDDISGSEV